MKKRKSIRVYWGGELFKLNDLLGNLIFADAIREASGGKYEFILPQNYKREDIKNMRWIREKCYWDLLESDAAVFNFDGTDADSGTVAEFKTAKDADIPAVILRTDLRQGGDDNEYPWNLMLSHFPRTKPLVLDAMGTFKGELEKAGKNVPAMEIALRTANKFTRSVIQALDTVMAMPPCLTKELAPYAYRALALTMGFEIGRQKATERMMEIFRRKVSKGFLSSLSFHCEPTKGGRQNEL